MVAVVYLSIWLAAGLKTKLLCETSSIFQVDSIKSETSLRDFLQEWKSWELTNLHSRRLGRRPCNNCGHSCLGCRGGAWQPPWRTTRWIWSTLCGCCFGSSFRVMLEGAWASAVACSFRPKDTRYARRIRLRLCLGLSITLGTLSFGIWLCRIILAFAFGWTLWVTGWFGFRLRLWLSLGSCSSFCRFPTFTYITFLRLCLCLSLCLQRCSDCLCQSNIEHEMCALNPLSYRYSPASSELLTLSTAMCTESVLMVASQEESN